MPTWQPPGLVPAAARRAGGLLGELAARPVRLGLAVAATVAAVALIGASPGSAAGGFHRRAPHHSPPPADIRTIMSAARACPGLDWRVLFAMYRVESDRGALAGRSAAGAVGPMQFLPATWQAYRSDGDGDGRTEVTVLADAATAAARMLCANGAGTPGGLHDALWSYNHSDAYVAQVMSKTAVAGR